jgi:hypothetical protein
VVARGPEATGATTAREPDKISSSLYFFVFHPPSILREALLLLLLHSFSDLVKIHELRPQQEH